jgi:integrase
MAKLTKRTTDALAPSAADFTVWDSELHGFGCRVHPGGRKTFVFKYRVGGGRGAAQRKMTLGRYSDAFTVDQARAMARQLHADVLKGKDPAGDRATHRQAETLEAFAQRYMSDHANAVKKASSAKQDQWMLDRYILPKLGSRKMVDLTSGDLTRFIRSHVATPIMANRLRALLSKMMSLAMAWDVRRDPVNPVLAIEKFPEQSCERYLSGDEMRRLGDVLREAETEASEPWQAIAAIRLLVLTGCRRNEVLAWQWPFIDRDNGLVALADSKTGRKPIYLTPPVLAVLDALPRTEGCPYVLPARPGREGHFVGVNHVWERLRKMAGLEDVRLHDLRHTFASKGVGLSIGLPLIGGLLGHAHATTTAKYAHLAADPTRRAGVRIARKLHAELGLAGKVVAFPDRRRIEAPAVAGTSPDPMAKSNRNNRKAASGSSGTSGMQ